MAKVYKKGIVGYYMWKGFFTTEEDIITKSLDFFADEFYSVKRHGLRFFQLTNWVMFFTGKVVENNKLYFNAEVFYFRINAINQVL